MKIQFQQAVKPLYTVMIQIFFTVCEEPQTVFQIVMRIGFCLLNQGMEHRIITPGTKQIKNRPVHAQCPAGLA